MTSVFTNLNLTFRDEKSGLVDSELVIEMWWKLTNIFISGWSNDQGSSARLLRNPIVIDLPVIRFAIFLPSIPAKFNVKIEILHCIYWYEQWGNVISRRRTLDRFKDLLQVVQTQAHFICLAKEKPHWLGMNYYVNFLGGIGSNGFHIKWISGTIEKIKSWGPFRSYQLNSTANLAHLPRNWAKWAELAVLFSW